MRTAVATRCERVITAGGGRASSFVGGWARSNRNPFCRPDSGIDLKSAGVTLVKGDLNGIVRARRLSAATMSNIRQNLFFAFVYNAAGVPIAAGALYPFFGVLLSPIIAAAAMALSSVSVIGNALRLRRVGL